MRAGIADDRGFQIKAALFATGLLLYVMFQAPGAMDEGLTPELIYASLPLVACIAWLFPVEVALIFIAATMFRLHEAYPFLIPFRLPLITAGLSALAAGLHMVARTMSFPAKLEMKLALAFAAHVTLALIFAVSRDTSWTHWSTNFSKLMAGMVLLAVTLRLPRDATKIGMVLIPAGMLVSLVAIYNQLNGIGLVEGNRVTVGRDVKSILGDPNDLCFVLMFPVAFALGTLMTKGAGAKMRLLSLVALPLIFWAILATRSRGGVLATLAVCAFFFMRTRKNFIVPLVATAALGAILFVASGIGERSMSAAVGDAVDASARGRLDAWWAATRMALAYPLFGVGMGNFSDLYFNYTSFWDGRGIATHSMWFQVLAEAGFIGLFLYVAMVVVAIRSAMRSLRLFDLHGAPPQVMALSCAVVAAWFGICVAGSFLSQAFSWQVFTLVALTAVIGRYADERYLARAKEMAESENFTPIGLRVARPALA